MTGSLTVDIVDGVRVVVPDSLDLITPFVLLEQQDWFEDEIRFLRRALRPGQQVLDIGANYGVYALSMAKTVGPSGRVVAFEPASETARLLAAGIAANGFDQVKLEKAALSSEIGQAQLSLNQDSELNALVRGAAAQAGASETVPVTTLDEALMRHGWQSIDFVKIDAEGEEASILRGGVRFFRDLSPLVQYEIRADAAVHLGLADQFAARGYASYRLVPGLGVLVPFDPQATPDGYLLNLFACKPDRAERLEAEGLLLRAPPASPPEPAEADGWRRSLAELPYAVPLVSLWSQTVAAGVSAEVERALALHAMSRDAARPLAERHAALQGSLDVLRTVCGQDTSFMRLASLARVAQEAGERALAVSALGQLANTMNENRQADAREPFLAPAARFERIAPGASFGSWIMAAVLEEFERLSLFSAFYAEMASLPRLEIIERLGLGSEEMRRRLQLVRRRFHLPGA
ncbi:FkbM family methyltransferase [Caenimonas sedimenti]|uniref:FkbM family methyltransferase n=1 Tax=Caenimonas sedimenti TaxID=2596921 RepID=A0A562ZUZ6_9BURK|nr:FkbM family methyltransferase [Caenimonas sedimenti]TWO72207.1 FkbM family methyltransferase [Caenimonas sedimenti]